MKIKRDVSEEQTPPSSRSKTESSKKPAGKMAQVVAFSTNFS
jgi:hypothetical protein